jgi:hypothetical protein
VQFYKKKKKLKILKKPWKIPKKTIKNPKNLKK